MRYTCPVCGYNQLEDAPANHEICPSCGTEFGYHDFTRSHVELRAQWLAKGAQWHSRIDPKPYGWNPYRQLFDAGLGYDLNAQSARNNKDVIILETGNYRDEELTIREILSMPPRVERSEITA
ncbi:MAG: hypothetical protein M3458_01040 [Acidobacteriota bacterium]|nr:hypothetical protein [Acidobacteriota bacterium]